MKNNLNICNDYKNRDKRIVVIDKKYSGLSDSRNTGIQYATGDYIGFVDSDDYIDKSMYKKLLFMSENTIQIFLCVILCKHLMIMKKTLYIEKYFKMDTNQALKFLLCDKTIKSMDNFEKACFFLMRTDLDSLKYFLERNLHYMQ